MALARYKWSQMDFLPFLLLLRLRVQFMDVDVFISSPSSVLTDMIPVVTDVLQQGMSINLYMFHGGTNFGFMNGAFAVDTPAPKPMVTSYGTCKYCIFTSIFNSPVRLLLRSHSRCWCFIVVLRFWPGLVSDSTTECKSVYSLVRNRFWEFPVETDTRTISRFEYGCNISSVCRWRYPASTLSAAYSLPVKMHEKCKLKMVQ